MNNKCDVCGKKGNFFSRLIDCQKGDCNKQICKDCTNDKKCNWEECENCYSLYCESCFKNHSCDSEENEEKEKMIIFSTNKRFCYIDFNTFSGEDNIVLINAIEEVENQGYKYDDKITAFFDRIWIFRKGE